MAQRKKKPSEHQLQAIATAHHRNEFMRKIKHNLNSCCGEDIYSLIPNYILDDLYLKRNHSLKVVEAKGHSIPKEVLNEIKAFVSKWTKDETIEYSLFPLKTTLDEYFTVGQSIVTLSRTIDKFKFPDIEKVKSVLIKFQNDEEIFRNAFFQLNNSFIAMANCVMNIRNRFYWMNMGVALADNGGMNYLVEIYTGVPTSINIKIDEKPRPVTRLGWAYPVTGIVWVTIKPSLLKIKNRLFDSPMDVYIQSHAFDRLAERIDCIYEIMAQYSLYLSLMEPKVCYDNNHELMIEYRIFGTKAGYFRIDVVGKIVVIRTFLFLTNNGTPESNLLEKNTGLKMLDKKYLAIDKLSTFMSSDIGRNEQIKKIFSDAGCESLLELYENVGPICTKHSDQSSLSLMLEYIGHDNTKDGINKSNLKLRL